MSKPTPSFPAAVWNGSAANRTNYGTDHKWPDPEDYDRLVEELRATQAHLRGLRDENLILLLAPAVAAGTDPVANKLNDLLTITTKDVIVAVGSSAVASIDFGYDIPAGSIVLAAAMNIQTAVTLATATKIGLGIAGSLAKYGSITGGTLNNKSTAAITPTAIASAEDLKIYATDNSSAAAGTIQNGSVRVRLTLLTQAALPDA